MEKGHDAQEKKDGSNETHEEKKEPMVKDEGLGGEVNVPATRRVESIHVRTNELLGDDVKSLEAGQLKSLSDNEVDEEENNENVSNLEVNLMQPTVAKEDEEQEEKMKVIKYICEKCGTATEEVIDNNDLKYNKEHVNDRRRIIVADAGIPLAFFGEPPTTTNSDRPLVAAEVLITNREAGEELVLSSLTPDCPLRHNCTELSHSDVNDYNEHRPGAYAVPGRASDVLPIWGRNIQERIRRRPSRSRIATACNESQPQTIDDNRVADSNSRFRTELTVEVSTVPYPNIEAIEIVYPTSKVETKGCKKQVEEFLKYGIYILCVCFLLSCTRIVAKVYQLAPKSGEETNLSGTYEPIESSVPTPTPLQSQYDDHNDTNSDYICQYQVSTSSVLMDIIKTVSSISDKWSLKNIHSAQCQAMAWISHEREKMVIENRFAVDNNKSYISSQRYVLAVMYFAMGGTEWKSKTNWLTEKHECEWEHLTCITGTPFVHKIEMGNNFLQGEIPGEVGYLNRLAVLDFQYNRALHGSIPDEIWNLSDLKILKLSKNSISGTISSRIKYMHNLNILQFNDNGLHGTIPAGVWHLSNLKAVHLNGNYLHGTLSECYLKIESLMESIDISFNRIEGQIPKTFSNFIKLENFNVFGNRINSTIPDYFSNLTQLKTLEMDENNISGSIPDSLNNLRKLKLLGLSGNKMYGKIPNWVGNFAYLEQLRLENNLITGTIPSEVGRLSQLRNLEVGNNELSGIVPWDIGDVTLLKRLDVSRNIVTGTVPSSISNLKDIEYIYFQANNLSGTVSSDICQLWYKNLKEFQVDSEKVECQCCFE